MKKALICAAMLACSAPAFAQVTAEFEPGQYEYTISAAVAGTVVEENTQSDCMTAAESRIDAAAVEAAMPGDVSCSYSDVDAKQGHVKSKYSCLLKDLGGVNFAGDADVKWTSSTFTIVMDGMMSGEGIPGAGAPMVMNIKGSRTGVCQ